MVINNSELEKSTKIIILVSIFALISFAPLISILPEVKGNLKPQGNQLNINSYDGRMVDKVYTFTVDRPFLFFDRNLYFKKLYNYYITVCIVTPHTCDLNITLWDPEGTEYQLSYENNMVQEDYREIPFGSAMAGNYSLLFNAVLTENLNIHINIERWDVCLYDKIQSEELPNIINHDVLKFYNKGFLTHSLIFKTNKFYRFYFGRVSAISIKLSSYTKLTHYIIDESQGIPFSIYINETVASPAYVTKYKFGTAVEGEYIINLTIYCNVDAVNIAYAVVEKDKIADGTDPNDDDPPPIPEAPINGTTGVEAYIPREWTIGMIVFVGSIVGIPILIFVYRKKRNPTGV
ncbi:MAG: hypothetical protein ACFE9M_04825 [Promethearchaeota archaeon]